MLARNWRRKQRLDAACSLGIMAAVAAYAAFTPAANAADGQGNRIVERGPHQDLVQEIWTEEVDGASVTRTKSHVVLGSGRNYWDDTTASWQPSGSSFQLINNGATFTQANFKLLVRTDVNHPDGNLEIFPKPETRIVMQTVGIAVTDALGDSVWLAMIKSADGVLTAPNEIIWPSCFEGLDASVRLVLREHGGGFEHDIILHENPDLSALNLVPPLKIEAFHEILAGPEPRLEPGQIARGNGETDVDAQLGFSQEHGELLIGPGNAFLVGEDKERLKGAAGKPVRVAKEYYIDPQTQVRFLIESVRVSSVSDHLEALPKAREARRIDSATRERLQAGRRTDGKRRHPLALMERPAVEGRRVAAMTRKDLPARGGLLLDYSSLVSETNLTFSGSTTYVVSSNSTVNLAGVTTLEAGTVIKVGTYNPTNGTPIINILGTLDCRTDAFSPAVFTSTEDRMIGETNTAALASIATNAYGAYHLCFPVSNGNAITLHDIRSRYAYNAFGFLGGGTVTAWNLQVVNAQGSAFEGSGNVTLLNVLAHDVGTVAEATANSTVFTGQHFTIHQAATNFQAATYTSCSFSLLNSLMIGITNMGSVGATSNYTYTASSAGGIFQGLGGASHFLADGSPFRGIGSSSINTNLSQNVFRYSTTHPPLLLTNTISINTTLTPRAERDWADFDYGYHYALADYALGGVSIANSVALTLTNGVSVVMFGTNSLTLGSGSKFISEGRPGPAALNRLTRYNAIAEQPDASALWAGAGSSRMMLNMGGAAGLVSIRMTRVSHLADTVSRRYLAYAAANIGTDVTLRDNEVFGSYLSLSQSDFTYGVPVGLTNNLFHRSTVEISQASSRTMTVNVKNNLFRHGTVTFTYQNAGTWTVKDNFFDQATVSQPYYSVANTHNAYYVTSAMSGASSTKTVTTLDYQSGLLGPWYYPNSGSGNLFPLVGGGSQTAANAALAHYGVQIDYSKDGSNVDIGYHLLPVDAAWLPLDYDGDSIPDYLEDRNGNGSPTPDTGETAWQTSNGTGSGAANLVVFTPLQ